MDSVPFAFQREYFRAVLLAALRLQPGLALSGLRARLEAIHNLFTLTVGYIDMPRMPYYAVTARSHLTWEFSINLDVFGHLSARYNDPETLTSFPYAVNPLALFLNFVFPLGT